jgi:hypothetical protein
MNKNIIWIAAIIIIVLGAVWYVRTAAPQTSTTSQTATSTPQDTTHTSQTTSDGTIAFSTPNDFALAVTAEQVQTKSYIPPCEENFNYCLYYNASAYKGTNFESAGLSIKKRADLSTERLCLDTPPAGFDASTQPTNTQSTNAYTTSVFENVGDAAAGHYSNGALYRLFVRNSSTCYEFLLRIGETQYANYPAGSIKEFTDADRQSLGEELTGMLQSITLASGEQIKFPVVK